MMLRPILLAPLLLLAGGEGTPRPPQRPDDPVARVVLQLEARRRAAHLAGDADALAAILADDFVEVGANGVARTKQENVGDTRRGVVRWTSLVARDERVTVFDSAAAVVTGEQEGSGSYGGQPFTRRVRYMRVYLERGGRWQNVAAHAALVAQ